MKTTLTIGSAAKLVVGSIALGAFLAGMAGLLLPNEMWIGCLVMGLVFPFFAIPLVGALTALRVRYLVWRTVRATM